MRCCVPDLNPNLTRRGPEKGAKSITSFPGGNSELAPPDPIPNSEVKRFSADGSVGSPHVRVGHCQDLIPKKAPTIISSGPFFLGIKSWQWPTRKMGIS